MALLTHPNTLTACTKRMHNQVAGARFAPSVDDLAVFGALLMGSHKRKGTSRWDGTGQCLHRSGLPPKVSALSFITSLICTSSLTLKAANTWHSSITQAT